VVDEYRYQFCGHFIGNPHCTKLIYVCYDGNDEDDEFDNGDLMDENRAVVFVYDRSEFEGLIEECLERIKIADDAINEALETGEKLEFILN